MNVFTKVVPMFMAAMLTLLVLGLININLYHHIQLPKELLNRNTVITEHDFSIRHLFITKTDIYLVDHITNYRQTQDVIEVLNQASSGDKVVFHLAGIGGGVEQVIRIINAMLTTKADVTTIVEAPVYSGHAYIALYGKTLKIMPFATIMLHTSSAFGYDCSKEKGVDRGETNKEVCEKYLKAHMGLSADLILDMPRVAPEDKIDLIFGKSLFFSNTSNKLITCKGEVCDGQLTK